MRKIFLLFLISLAFYQTAFACEPLIPTLRVQCADGSIQYIYIKYVANSPEIQSWPDVQIQLPDSCELDVPTELFETYLQDYLATRLNERFEFGVAPISQDRIHMMNRSNENIFECTGYEFTQSEDAILYRSYLKPTCRVAENFISSAFFWGWCIPSIAWSPFLFILQTIKSPTSNAIVSVVTTFLGCMAIVFGAYKARKEVFSSGVETILKLFIVSVGFFALIVFIWELMITL